VGLAKKMALIPSLKVDLNIVFNDTSIVSLNEYK
jgi:hypothetical protein